MQESAVMEIVKWFITLFLIMGIVSLTYFGIQLANVNSFKQQVNYQIERQGGLTEEAVQNLKEYSDKSYKGSFTVKSDQLNEKVEFGEIVDYQVVGKFDIILFPLPDVTMTFSGSGISQVR